MSKTDKPENIDVSLTKHLNACVKKITKACSAPERKLFYATAEFISLQLPIQLMKKWVEILKVAKKNSTQGDPAVVALGVSIKLDLSDPNIVSVKIDSKFT